MFSRKLFLSFLMVLLPAPELCGQAQRNVNPRDLYERVVAIVPMTGAGTYEDPRRPLWTPAKLSGRNAADIVSFSYQLSDDGNFAVVEVASREREGLRDLLNERRPGVRVFERGKANAAEAEQEIRKLIRNFDLSKFGGIRPTNPC